MARLFVAIWPPQDVVAVLTTLRRKDQRGVRFVRPANWHVTLRFLGEARPEEVIDALDEARLSPARARVGPGVDALGDRALIVPVQGLDELAATIAQYTAQIGKPPRRRFAGHLTIARTKRYAQMPEALGSFVSAEFDVVEVALVRSRLDPEGARYETLRTWPLP